jgi:acyl-CoA thioesterase YciA
MQEATIRVVAYPQNSNPDGDVFGGWILSMMDMAAAIPARRLARTRVVTIAVENMKFLLPVFIGDCIECYAEIEKIGNTSITVRVETYVERREGPSEKEKVTEGRFVFVAIGRDRRPIKVPRPAV